MTAPPPRPCPRCARTLRDTERLATACFVAALFFAALAMWNAHERDRARAELACPAVEVRR